MELAQDCTQRLALISLIAYELDDQGFFLGRDIEGIFSLRHRVQTGSGTHSASYPMGNGCSYPRKKATGA